MDIEPQQTGEASTSRAIVPLAARAAGAGVASRPKPLAGFVAQLLACREAVPDYRERRRAGPGAAAASYGTMSAEPRPGDQPHPGCGRLELVL
jgi:hypothetical protein